MGESVPASNAQSPPPNDREAISWVTAVGSDWWATLLGLFLVLLAVANVLPKIPW